MGFKVATKWNAWSHIVRIKEQSQAPLDSAEFEIRYRFSSWIMSRFLIGTLANILTSVIGVAAYIWLLKTCVR